jgi:hypothetical protein
MIKKTALQDAISPRTFDPVPDRIRIFQIDRANMMLHLQSLRRAIDRGAEEIEMVSAESVFGKSLSRTLSRSARKLRLAAKDLHRLVRLVEQARAPNASEAPDRKTNRRNRRYDRN